MGKKPKETVAVEEDAGGKKQFKGHHSSFLTQGWVQLDTSRPRGKPHVLEEWLDRQRQLHILKVSDSGEIVQYTEVARVPAG